MVFAMITRIREVRKAKNLTLDEVASRCSPPTTAQTIGRLETGTRTVSVGWLNRIADALGVDAADLVDHPERAEMEVVAAMAPQGSDGAEVLAARRAKAQRQLADSVAALEGIRLDLLRLHAGAADLQPLTTLMDAAKLLGDDVRRLEEAQREVEDATHGTRND